MILGVAHLGAALEQSWPPFVLVVGLLLLGQLAGADGVFDAAAARLVRMPGGTRTCFAGCLGLVAVVTALLNLDTAAVFLTPVLIGVARRRGLHAAPFLYGAIFMTNASSLFLPGSNLTNLLVLSERHRGSGAEFLATMLPAAAAATLATVAGLFAIHRRALSDAPIRPVEPTSEQRLTWGVGLWGALGAAVLILALHDPALPVLALALAMLGWRLVRHGAPTLRRSIASLGLPSLLALFALAVLLGVAARSGLVSLDGLRRAGAVPTTATAALLSVLVNNLPAAVLLSSSGHLQARALLIGLNVGPNLAVTGSLSVLLWWRAARAADTTPSVRAYWRQGLLLAPFAIALASLASLL